MAWILACMLAVLVALWVDRLWGEPPAWVHPVVVMGRYLGLMGPALTHLPAPLALLGGAMAWCLGACLVTAAGLAMELGWHWLVSTLAWPAWASAILAGLGLGLLLKPFLAWRMLRDEVHQVEQALGQSLQAGQTQLRRLVSRDVHQLDDVGVRESAIESLAENLNDSLVAPLFWFALLGLPGAALYRFANTADAMWGYRGPYEWAGKWAAKLDDLLSWLPARLTALLLCAAAGCWPGLARMRAQARLTPSPNGGWPMGAMALLLGVSLRKPGAYALNEQAGAPLARHTQAALLMAGRAAWLAALVSALVQAVPLVIGWGR